MFFLQRNLGPCTKGTLFENSERFSDSPISSQIKQETYSQLCIIALWDLIHTREPVNFCKQLCIEMKEQFTKCTSNRVILEVMNQFSYLWRCKSVLCEYWCALGYCQLVLWSLKTINGCGVKWPWNLAAAWEGSGLPVANSTELRSKDTQCSFKSFLLSFSCQLYMAGFAVSYSVVFVSIDSFPPYTELHCWKCTPFSDLLLQATSDIVQLLLPQHSSPASLLCLWLSGGQH